MDGPAEQIKKECIICEKGETPELKMINLFGPKEHICLPCYAEQNQMIVDYKKNKPVLYPDYNQIMDNLFLGNEDTAMDEAVITKENISAICVCGSFLLTPFEDTAMDGQF